MRKISLLVILIPSILLITGVDLNHNGLWDDAIRKSKNVLDGLQFRVATYEVSSSIKKKKRIRDKIVKQSFSARVHDIVIQQSCIIQKKNIMIKTRILILVRV